ncbi:MAG: hypothetical protein ACTSPM_11120 [Candidatus Heimdallarchaeota archaeon]
MKHSYKVGFSFGLTSGIITTLGLMVGLYSSTNSQLVVIGGILTIAIADSLSDSLGIHISEESEINHTSKEIWESTFSTLLCKFIFSSMFIFPVLLLELRTSIIFCVMFGFMILFILSLYMAKQENTKAWKVIGEHLTIAAVVIILTYCVGYWISLAFN